MCLCDCYCACLREREAGREGGYVFECVRERQREGACVCVAFLYFWKIFLDVKNGRKFVFTISNYIYICMYTSSTHKYNDVSQREIVGKLL